MATVVNLFRDERFENIGRGLGNAVGAGLEERRRREEQRQRDEVINQVMGSPSEEMGGPSENDNLAQLISVGIEPRDALGLIKQRSDIQRRQNLETDFDDFFRLTESGDVSARDALLEIGNPDVIQPLSQGGFLGKGSEVKLFRGDGSREVLWNDAVERTNENLQRLKPEAFSLGYRFDQPAGGAKGGGGDGGLKPDKTERDAIAILRSAGVEPDDSNISRARDFALQRENAFDDIEQTIGTVNEATGAVFIAPGATQDVVNEAKGLLRDRFLNSEKPISLRRAVGESIQEARRRVDSLEHIDLAKNNTPEKLVKSLKNRGWEEQNVREALEAQNLLSQKAEAALEKVYR